MFKNLYILVCCCIVLTPYSQLYADSGALYEAWDEGESIITEQKKTSTAFGDFYYSDDGEPPPPPPKPKWQRFKPLSENEVIKNAADKDSDGLTRESYQEYSSDPFQDRINDIESLLEN